MKLQATMSTGRKNAYSTRSDGLTLQVYFGDIQRTRSNNVAISIYDRAGNNRDLPELPQGSDTSPVLYEIGNLELLAGALGWRDFRV